MYGYVWGWKSRSAKPCWFIRTFTHNCPQSCWRNYIENMFLNPETNPSKSSIHGYETSIENTSCIDIDPIWSHIMLIIDDHVMSKNVDLGPRPGRATMRMAGGFEFMDANEQDPGDPGNNKWLVVFTHFLGISRNGKSIWSNQKSGLDPWSVTHVDGTSASQGVVVQKRVGHIYVMYRIRTVITM